MKRIVGYIVTGVYCVGIGTALKGGYEISQMSGSQGIKTVQSVETTRPLVKRESPKEKSTPWFGEKIKWTGEEEVVNYIPAGGYIFAISKSGERIPLTYHSADYFYRWVRKRTDGEDLTGLKKENRFKPYCRPFLFFFQTCAPPLSNKIRTRLDAHGMKYGEIIRGPFE